MSLANTTPARAGFPIWRTARRVMFFAALFACLAFFITPVLWMVATAFKEPGEYVSATPSFFPSTLTLQHFTSLLEDGFLLRLGNTLTVAFAATAASILLGFCAAYALVRYRFPARLDIAFLLLVLIVKLMPPIVVAIPLYSLLKDLGLLDSLLGLALVYQLYTLPFCIWMLLGFVRDVPLEIEEAAALDNANLMQRLWYIVLPLCKPGLVATSIFTLILCWNEFPFALLFLQKPSTFTLPLYISNFITENETFWGELMGIGLLSSIPVLLFAGFIQKHLIRGFSMGLK
ncbi:MAG: carbohydrate ABC transporter permease [Pseudomonadales bacterium]